MTRRNQLGDGAVVVVAVLRDEHQIVGAGAERRDVASCIAPAVPSAKAICVLDAAQDKERCVPGVYLGHGCGIDRRQVRRDQESFVWHHERRALAWSRLVGWFIWQAIGDQYREDDRSHVSW